MFALALSLAPVPAKGQANAPMQPPDKWTGGQRRSINDKAFDTMNAKDFGVKADGVADDTAALQNAINASIKHGHWLTLPPSSIKITGTIHLNVGTQGVRMIGTTVSNDATGTAIKYAGTDTAFRANNVNNFGTCPSDVGPNALNYDGHLSKFQILISGAAKSAIDLCGAQQWYIDRVSISTEEKATVTNGLLCTSCAIMWFDLMTFAGGTGAIPLRMTNAFAIGGASSGPIWIRGNDIFAVTNAIRLDGGGIGLFVFDNWWEAVDAALWMTDASYPGAQVAWTDVFVEHNRGSYAGATPNLTPVKIENLNAKQLLLKNFVYAENSDVSLTNGNRFAVTSANAKRGKSTVTMAGKYSQASPAFIQGAQVFLQGGDVNFPGGYKTIATSAGSTITYNETSPCVQASCTAGTCAAGTCQTAGDKIVSFPAYPIRVVYNVASQNQGSNVYGKVMGNNFQGWDYGIVHGTRAAPPGGNNGINFRAIDNYTVDTGGAGALRRANEVLVTSPLNGGDAMFVSHTPTAGTVQVAGGGTATVLLIDGQNYCVCSDTAAKPQACSTSVNTETFMLTITLAGSAAPHTVTYYCF
jgi:hypothetical protein